MKPTQLATKLLEADDSFSAEEYIKSGTEEASTPIYDGPIVRILIPHNVHTVNDYLYKSEAKGEGWFDEVGKKPIYIVYDYRESKKGQEHLDLGARAVLVQFETDYVYTATGTRTTLRELKGTLAEDAYMDAVNGFVQYFQTQIAAKKNVRQAVTNLVLLGRTDLAANYARHINRTNMSLGRAIETTLALKKVGKRSRSRIARFMKAQTNVKWGEHGFWLLFDDWQDLAPFFGESRDQDYAKNAEKIFNNDAYEWFDDGEPSVEDAWSYLDDKNLDIIRQLLVGRTVYNSDGEEYTVQPDWVAELDDDELKDIVCDRGNKDSSCDDIYTAILRGSSDAHHSEMESAYYNGYQQALLDEWGLLMDRDVKWIGVGPKERDKKLGDGMVQKGDKKQMLGLYFLYATLEEWIAKWKEDEYEDDYYGDIHDLAKAYLPKVKPNDEYSGSGDMDYFNEQAKQHLTEIDPVQPERQTDPQQPEFPLDDPSGKTRDLEVSHKVRVGNKEYAGVAAPEARKYRDVMRNHRSDVYAYAESFLSFPLSPVNESDSDVKIEFTASQEGAESVVPLLKELRSMGMAGSSRSIKIEDYDGKNSFGFDGDGSAKIGEIKVGGKVVESLINDEDPKDLAAQPVGYRIKATARRMIGDHVPKGREKWLVWPEGQALGKIGRWMDDANTATIFSREEAEEHAQRMGPAIERAYALDIEPVYESEDPKAYVQERPPVGFRLQAMHHAGHPIYFLRGTWVQTPEDASVFTSPEAAEEEADKCDPAGGWRKLDDVRVEPVYESEQLDPKEYAQSMNCIVKCGHGQFLKSPPNGAWAAEWTSNRNEAAVIPYAQGQEFLNSIHAGQPYHPLAKTARLELVSESEDPKDFVSDISVDPNSAWSLVDAKTDPNGQFGRLYKHKSGASFKLIHTFYGNDKAPFSTDWLKDYSVYAYDEHGDFVDGDHIESDSPDEALKAAAEWALKALTDYSPSLMNMTRKKRTRESVDDYLDDPKDYVEQPCHYRVIAEYQGETVYYSGPEAWSRDAFGARLFDSVDDAQNSSGFKTNEIWMKKPPEVEPIAKDECTCYEPRVTESIGGFMIMTRTSAGLAFLSDAGWVREPRKARTFASQEDAQAELQRLQLDTGEVSVVPTGLQEAQELNEDIYKSSTTQIDLPDNIGQHIISWGKLNIPDDALYIDEDGGCGRETEQHVTVLYGLKEPTPSDALKDIVGNTKPFLVELSGVTLFENEKYDVVKLDVISEELTNLSNAIRKACPNNNKFPDYHGHVTIAYVKPGRGKEFLGQDVFKAAQVPRDFWAYEMKFKGAGDSEDPNRVVDVLYFDKEGDPGHEEPPPGRTRYPKAQRVDLDTVLQHVADMQSEVAMAESEEVDPKQFVTDKPVEFYVLRGSYNGRILWYAEPQSGSSVASWRSGEAGRLDAIAFTNLDAAQTALDAEQKQHSHVRMELYPCYDMAAWWGDRVQESEDNPKDYAARVSMNYMLRTQANGSLLWWDGNHNKWVAHDSQASTYSEGDAAKILAEFQRNYPNFNFEIVPDEIDRSLPESEQVDPKEFLGGQTYVVRRGIGAQAQYLQRRGQNYVWISDPDDATTFPHEAAVGMVTTLRHTYEDARVEMIDESDDTDPKDLASEVSAFIVRIELPTQHEFKNPPYYIATDDSYFTQDRGKAAIFYSKEEAEELIRDIGPFPDGHVPAIVPISESDDQVDPKEHLNDTPYPCVIRKNRPLLGKDREFYWSVDNACWAQTPGLFSVFPNRAAAEKAVEIMRTSYPGGGKTFDAATVEPYVAVNESGIDPKDFVQQNIPGGHETHWEKRDLVCSCGWRYNNVGDWSASIPNAFKAFRQHVIDSGGELPEQDLDESVVDDDLPGEVTSFLRKVRSKRKKPSAKTVL